MRNDRALFVDPHLPALVEAIWEQLESGATSRDPHRRAHMPRPHGPGALCYEDLLACTTTATTSGRPSTSGPPPGSATPRARPGTRRGSSTPIARPCSTPSGWPWRRRHPAGAGEAVLMVVPMFHRQRAWGIPIRAAMCGYRVVMPGPPPGRCGLTELMNAERVTTYWRGVPSVHLGLSSALEGASGQSAPLAQPSTNGGAAPTPRMIREFRSRGIAVVHGWGIDRDQPGRDRSARSRKRSAIWTTRPRSRSSCGRDASSSGLDRCA
jgi:fatty-acyl-CoA synthase